MANVEYPGWPSGKSKRRAVRKVKPRIVESLAWAALPLRYRGRNDVVYVRVVGDSMSPTLLDNDQIIVAMGLAPSPNDIVLIPFEEVPSLPGVRLAIARYKCVDGRTFITKDQPRYARYKVEVTDQQILGVAVEILPRDGRNPHENHFTVQSFAEIYRDRHEKIPADLGFFLDGRTTEFLRALEIPDCEFFSRRLPWGCFRAFAREPQPHVGIGTRDVLTIDPSAESFVGQLVLKASRKGDSLFGILQRDGLHDPTPGRFWLGPTDGSDFRVEVDDDAWYHRGVVARIDRADHVALAAGRSHSDRRENSGGREDLL
jgi:peptidase S24-like protein